MTIAQSAYAAIIKAGNFATPAGNKLYDFALAALGQNLCPGNNELGCAQSVNAVSIKAFGIPVGGGVSTEQMALILPTNPRFIRVTKPIKGDIVISPSGQGNGHLPNGHVGIVGDNGQVMSNNSDNGIWDIHYSLATWAARYVGIGGFPMLYYRRLLM